MNKGFTLIELMIAIACLAILCFFGVPLYREYIIKSERKVIHSQLLNAKHWMIQQLTLKNRFYDSNLPKDFRQVPLSGTPKVVLSVKIHEGAKSFTITATRVKGDDVKCGNTWTINETGSISVKGEYDYCINGVGSG